MGKGRAAISFLDDTVPQGIELARAICRMVRRWQNERFLQLLGCTHRSWGGDRVAFFWEGEPGDTRVLTYRDMHREVCRFANGLKKLGVGQGDSSAFICPWCQNWPSRCWHALGLVPFTPSSSVASRPKRSPIETTMPRQKCRSRPDGGYRRGKALPLKAVVDDALAKSPTVEHCVVYRRTGEQVAMKDGRDHWWHELTADCPMTAPLYRSIARIRSLSSTPVDRPESLKGFGIRLLAITCMLGERSNGYLTIAKATYSGVRPTVVGSPDTAISSTAQ